MTATDAPRHRTDDLATRLGGRLVGRSDVLIRGVDTLEFAADGHLTFIGTKTYAAQWPDCRAAAAIVDATLGLADAPPDDRPLIIVDDVDLAMIAALTLFAPTPDRPARGVHPSAVIHPDASIPESAAIGPFVSIGADTVLGADVVLHPGVRLGASVTIGDGSELNANVVVGDRCRVGARVLIHANVCIGADGFGFAASADRRHLVKVPHIGLVEIGDDVEIGAGSCVDRAKFGVTSVGSGTKIDNLVQIAHTCRIGRNGVIAAGTGIGGTTVIGDWVRIGGHVSIADHLTLGHGVQVAARAGVMRDVPDGRVVSGFPADEAAATLRQWAALRRLPDFLKRVSGRPGPTRSEP
jgi:UDP-3-O-[3-hydroxymyristoyl] glucosamine N-acyltransferase